MRCGAAIVAFTACLMPPLHAENITATTTGTTVGTTYSTFLSRSTATTTTVTATLTTNTHTETATTTTTDTETATTTTTHTQTIATVTETDTSTTTTTLAETATIAGSINMAVSNISAFVIDPQVKAALVASVAATAGVQEGYVTVTRRAVATLGEGGSGQVVELSYTIALPPDEPAATLAESKRIKAAFGTTREQVEQRLGVMTATITKRVDEAVGSGLYTVDVTDMSIPEVRIDVAQAATKPTPAEQESKLRPIMVVVVALAVALLGALVIGLLCCCRRRR